MFKKSISLAAFTFIAGLVSLDQGPVFSAPVGEPVATSGAVSVYELDSKYKQVILGSDNQIYAIEYSMWSTPGDLPGISNGQWYEDEYIGKFFPWAFSQKVSRSLSEKSQAFLCPDAQNCELVDEDGDLMLYTYNNGGGFVYGDWPPKPEGIDNRPGGTSPQGLLYAYNGSDYYTKGGSDGRIQAYGGCVVNTISEGVTTDKIVSSGFCEWDGSAVSTSKYAPVFTGGTFKSDNLDSLDNNFFLHYLNGSDDYIVGIIDNNGTSLEFDGTFNSTDVNSKNTSGKLVFQGSGTTSLNNQLNLYGDLEVAERSKLSITSSVDKSITTPLEFLDGKNTNGKIDASKSSNVLSILEDAILKVTGNDLGTSVGPRSPGQPSSEATIAAHRSPVINFNAGEDRFTIGKRSLAVVSYTDFLPSDYDKYRNNCKKDQEPGTCYQAVPQIDFGAGDDQLINEGVLVGPGEGNTGNYLEIAFRGGDDVVENTGYLGCLTSAADDGGWNGSKAGNTCSDANKSVGGTLPDDTNANLNRNYNVNLLLHGGNDVFTNSGYLRGSVNMGPGDDIIVSTGGIRGGITLSAGSDELTIQQIDSEGSGVVDDFITLGSSRDLSKDSSNESDYNKMVLQGKAIISFRNSLGFNSTTCGLKNNTTGGYGCRWDGDSGYDYLSITGSVGSDYIIVSNQSDNAPAQIWGKVVLGRGDDSFVVDTTGNVEVYGDVDFGIGNDIFTNQGELMLPGENQNASVPSGNILMGPGSDTVTTNSNISGPGYIDGGVGRGDVDTINFISLDEEVHQFKVGKVRNFEVANQFDGQWDYDGDYKAAGIGTMTIVGGRFLVLDSEQATFDHFVMNGGEIYASLESKNAAPLVSDTFDYQGGSLVINAGQQDDPEGAYTVIKSESQTEMNQLAANSQLLYDDNVGDFSGIGEINGISGSAIYDVYLREGSLQLVVSQKTSDEIIDCLEDDSCDKDVSSGDKDIVDEITEPGSPGSEIVDKILDDILAEIDLPIIDYGTLAKLIVSGLAPRNIDGPGRGMATYNNLLADTLFERLSLRQFDPVIMEKTVVEKKQSIEQGELIEEDLEPPVRGLWSKNGEISEEQAQQALDQVIAQSAGPLLDESTLVESLETVGFEEDPSITAQYSGRDGVRAWFRAFGGDDRDSYNDNFYNPYYVSAGGGVLGVDVSVSESFQVGAFVNYGNINLIQQNALAGGGSWNPDGWGGGLRADYWTKNFYLQGLFSATAFSGNHKRNIIEITSQLGDETASGTKSSTSYGLAFRVGAPFESGNFLLEPQFTTTWSFNNENRFTERGADQLNLTYKNRSTTYVQTDLAMKFAYPIKTGDTSQLVPSLRVGWLGDWSDNLSNQTIGYQFTDDTVEIKSKNKNTNGLLLEAGLDYTIANINSSSYKVYLRGGIEAWGGDRGTDYRTSGGFEWQF